jgi:hypothetical protein
VDWLEQFLPFLRMLDGGDGALEAALVIAVTAVGATVAYRWRRRTPRLE